MTKYVVITPARDEAGHIGETIRSLCSQSILPAEWVIVNDGSRDETGVLADEAAAAHSWIHVVHRTDRGARLAGGGVMEAFYDGFQQLQVNDWDFIVKLDADLSFDSDYFATCFRRFEQDPHLGIGGGAVYDVVDGKKVIEGLNEPLFHVRGATKIYHRACWEGIGPLLKAPGWDTLDEVKANMLGWHSRRFNDLLLQHHKVTGAADGIWKNWFKNGRANYITGYHPLFMVIKCIKRMVQRPYVVGAVGLLCGYITGYIRHVPRVPDEALIQYLHGQQLGFLLGRKSLWSKEDY